ncbi:MAG: bifunctional oligoribonuclease/PAP phosphatase NrnA [Frankiaceae bacterium]
MTVTAKADERRNDSPRRASRATTLADRDWDAALRLLSKARRVALLCHLHPDGDALGSMLALGIGLRRLGTDVVACWSGGVELPPTYRMLPGREILVPPSTFPPAPSLLVTLDTSSRERLGELEAVLDGAKSVLVIDHHAVGDGFGTHHLIDDTAAATAVVVEELLRRLGVALDAEIATCLYTGLTTDTGSFKYASTTPAVHELAARLLGTGIRHDVLARQIWDTNPFSYLRLLGTALNRAAIDPQAAGGLGVVWTWTSRDELDTYGLTMPEIEGFIDVLRTADSAEVAVVCKGDSDGTVKVSTRSKGQIDVGEICARLGGGGHRFAAGFTSDVGVGETMRSLLQLLASAPHLPA